MHTQNQKRYVEVKMTLKGLAFVLKMEENVCALQRQLSLKWKTSLNLLCTPVCMIYTIHRKNTIMVSWICLFLSLLVRIWCHLARVNYWWEKPSLMSILQWISSHIRFLQLCLNFYYSLDIVEKSSVMVHRKPIILRHKWTSI